MIFKRFGVCNILLEIYFQNLSNGILQASKIQTFQLVGQKNKFALEFLSSRCPTLFGETCGNQGRARWKWHVLWAMIWSKHIEGGYVKKRVLWALHSGKGCILSPQKNFIKHLSKRQFFAIDLCLFLPGHLSCFSHCKTRWTMSIHILGLENCVWGPRPSWSLCHFCLSVNQSGHGTNSTTNQHSYNAMGRFHGP